MSDILKQVRHTIETHELLTSGDGVVVGVSGGPDSLCLLDVLLRLRDAYDLRLHVAHLHHGARGADADADAEFVAGLAARWGVPIRVEKQDVPALARAHKLAFEEAARRVRYAFLARISDEVGAQKIAVGHNADDQAETVLMHFLRGSGLGGLRGMLPLTPLTDYRLWDPFAWTPSEMIRQTVAIVRPLLETPRAQIEQYCTSQGLTPRFDLSNLDTTHFRNRLRHELLPLLETYNPNIRARLCHTGTVVAADYALLVGLEERAWMEIVREASDSAIALDRAQWQALPAALQRATLRRAAFRLRRTLRDVNFVHVEHARQVGLKGETGSQATLPMGLVLTVSYDTLNVGDSDAAFPPPPHDEDQPLLWSTEPSPVQVPGTTALAESAWILQTTVLDDCTATQVAANPDLWTAYLDADKFAGSPVLRSRRRGDRFRPQGMAGHSVKLSSFMINRKIPRAWRDRVPLLAAGSEIAWVCGHRIAENFVVGPHTQRAIKFQFVLLD